MREKERERERGRERERERKRERESESERWREKERESESERERKREGERERERERVIEEYSSFLIDYAMSVAGIFFYSLVSFSPPFVSFPLSNCYNWFKMSRFCF